jgi:hypothetical protein
MASLKALENAYRDAEALVSRIRYEYTKGRATLQDVAAAEIKASAALRMLDQARYGRRGK